MGKYLDVVTEKWYKFLIATIEAGDMLFSNLSFEKNWLRGVYHTRMRAWRNLGKVEGRMKYRQWRANNWRE